MNASTLPRLIASLLIAEDEDEDDDDVINVSAICSSLVFVIFFLNRSRRNA